MNERDTRPHLGYWSFRSFAQTCVEKSPETLPNCRVMRSTFIANLSAAQHILSLQRLLFSEDGGKSVMIEEEITLKVNGHGQICYSITWIVSKLIQDRESTRSILKQSSQRASERFNNDDNIADQDCAIKLRKTRHETRNEFNKSLANSSMKQCNVTAPHVCPWSAS